MFNFNILITQVEGTDWWRVHVVKTFLWVKMFEVTCAFPIEQQAFDFAMHSIEEWGGVSK